MRVLICGDRDWTDGAVILNLLEGICNTWAEDTVIIEGCARGADSYACTWQYMAAHEHYPADWALHGKSAGPKRNAQMLSEGMPDVVYAFHDDLENSKGTLDMVRRAKRAHVPVYVISHPVWVTV